MTEARLDHCGPLSKQKASARECGLINSLFKAHDVTCYNGKVHKALPVDKGIDRLRAENKLPAAK